jgi:hypothetical protein
VEFIKGIHHPSIVKSPSSVSDAATLVDPDADVEDDEEVLRIDPYPSFVVVESIMTVPVVVTG